MAKNKWSSDAFKKAQNLLSPGYNSLDTFEPVTTLSKDDAMALARTMKLDTGVTGYGNTPFNDNQASIGAYFPNMNEAEILPLDLDNESSITSRDLSIPTPSKNLSNVNYQNPTVELNAAQKALNAISLALSDGGVKPFKDGKVSGESFYIRDKYNEIFNNGSSNDARDDGKVTADVPEYVRPSADKLAAYEETGLPYNPGNIEAGQDFEGETGTYRNGRFAWFESPEAGLRAMKMDLTKKLNDFDGNLPAMIEKYASKKDGNDTAAYLKVVQQYAGKKKVYSPSDLDNIMRGFIAMENKAATRDFYFDILDSQ